MNDFTTVLHRCSHGCILHGFYCLLTVQFLPACNRFMCAREYNAQVNICAYFTPRYHFTLSRRFLAIELIPRPARACPDPPMYLRLRMGRKIGKNTPLPTTVMSYGKNKLRPEYWFSIPKNK